MLWNSRTYFIAGGGAVLAAALAVAATVNHRAAPVTIPEQTSLQVVLDQTITSRGNSSGDHFEATVAQPVMVDGKVAIPEGAKATGLVVESHESGRLKGRAQLRLALESVDVSGKTYEIRTASSDRVSGNHKNRNIALIGGGAGGGALIGAIAGGGKGVLIGGPVGAGAGLATAFFTGKKDVRLPAETRLTFRLSQPVTIDVKKS